MYVCSDQPGILAQLDQHNFCVLSRQDFGPLLPWRQHIPSPFIYHTQLAPGHPPPPSIIFYLPIYHTYTHTYTYTHALATFPLLLPIRSLIHVPHKLAPDFLPSPSLLPKPPSQRHPRSNRQIF